MLKDLFKGMDTYRESDGANMGSEVLLDRPSCTELVAGRDHPEPCWRVPAYPTMYYVVLVLAGILVLVIHLCHSPENHGQY